MVFQARATGPALLLTAEVGTDPARITLHFGPPPEGIVARRYTIWRKEKGALSWGQSGYGGAVQPYVSGIAGSATSWTDPDPDIRVGSAYEYRVRRENQGALPSLGFIFAGIEVPLVEHRGKAILVVDDTFTVPLREELQRLTDDLAGDGWDVLRFSFDRGVPVGDPRYADQVRELRRIIHAIYRADPEGVKALLLFGHLPVPYSGQIAPDWHSPDNDPRQRNAWHIGAWPTDAYYGDMDSEWPDDRVRETRSAFSRNHNAPGDGKFDVSVFDDRRLEGYAPEGYPLTELQVGRVDLYDLPAFGMTEEQLLRRYLDKNHAFRHRQKTYRPQGLIDYNLPEQRRGLFENNGARRSFAALFGPGQVHANPAVDWFTTLGRTNYLWAVGAGQGAFTRVAGVGATADFAARPARVVFTALYGSYFGDWDNRDNVLRATLANEDILTCVWLGPQLNANFGLALHHMALGETIAYSVDVTHAQGRLYHESSMRIDMGMLRLTHVSLMGDPTLRLHPMAPPSGLAFAPGSAPGTLELNWRPSEEAGHPDFRGYWLGTAPVRSGPYTAVQTQPRVSGTRVELPSALGPWIMVRALKLERTPSGTYLNASQGILGRPPAS